MTKTIGWLLPRLGWTVGFLYAANFVATVATLFILATVMGWHSKSPAWFGVWFTVGIIAPLGIAALVGIVWGVVRLSKYWRES